MKVIKFKQAILATLLVFFLGLQIGQAQTVDRKNRVEYQEQESELDDLNTISLKKPRTVQRRKPKKSRVTGADISIEDLQAISKLHFRKKNKKSGKCLKEAETSCSSIEEKSKLLLDKAKKK